MFLKTVVLRVIKRHLLNLLSAIARLCSTLLLNLLSIVLQGNWQGHRPLLGGVRWKRLRGGGSQSCWKTCPGSRPNPWVPSGRPRVKATQFSGADPIQRLGRILKTLHKGKHHWRHSLWNGTTILKYHPPAQSATSHALLKSHNLARY